jgi:hypothetical protein
MAKLPIARSHGGAAGGVEEKLEVIEKAGGKSFTEGRNG